MGARDVNVNLSVVESSLRREVDVNVCSGLGLGRSAFFPDVDILSAARTVVMILFTSYVDLFLTKIVLCWKTGGEGRVLTFPSDALALW